MEKTYAVSLDVTVFLCTHVPDRPDLSCTGTIALAIQIWYGLCFCSDDMIPCSVHDADAGARRLMRESRDPRAEHTFSVLSHQQATVPRDWFCDVAGRLSSLLSSRPSPSMAACGWTEP